MNSICLYLLFQTTRPLLLSIASRAFPSPRVDSYKSSPADAFDTTLTDTKNFMTKLDMERD